jgi:hypothetical protein
MKNMQHAIKTHWGAEIWLHESLTSTSDGSGEWLASRPGKRAAPHSRWRAGLISGQVQPRWRGETILSQPQIELRSFSPRRVTILSYPNSYPWRVLCSKFRRDRHRRKLLLSTAQISLVLTLASTIWKMYYVSVPVNNPQTTCLTKQLRKDEYQDFVTTVQL